MGFRCVVFGWLDMNPAFQVQYACLTVWKCHVWVWAQPCWMDKRDKRLGCTAYYGGWNFQRSHRHRLVSPDFHRSPTSICGGGIFRSPMVSLFWSLGPNIGPPSSLKLEVVYALEIFGPRFQVPCYVSRFFVHSTLLLFPNSSDFIFPPTILGCHGKGIKNGLSPRGHGTGLWKRGLTETSPQAVRL